MKKIRLLVLLVCIMFFSGCAENRSSEKTIFAMDTVMTLKAFGERADEALDAAQKEIYRLDELFDRNDGEVSRLNMTSGMQVSEEVSEIVANALEICKDTDGAFDITIAPVMDLWGFYSKEFKVPSDDELEHELRFVGYEKIHSDGNLITLSDGAKIDLGGIAKGYTSKRIREIFGKYGIESGMISLGGNVEAIGSKPDRGEWKVAIQQPDNPQEYIGIVSVKDTAVITSGDYQRFFEENGCRYHHIIDTETGYPAENGLRSVTIICDDSTKADALSTALFVMGMENGVEYWKQREGFDIIFSDKEGKVYITEGIKDKFKSNIDYEIIRK